MDIYNEKTPFYKIEISVEGTRTVAMLTNLDRFSSEIVLNAPLMRVMAALEELGFQPFSNKVFLASADPEGNPMGRQSLMMVSDKVLGSEKIKKALGAARTYTG